MALEILNGYLISKSDYDLFDEILVFLTKNKKLVLYSQGSRKINSKNARNLMYMDFLEIECFVSPDINKMGKLKKVTSISSFEFENWNTKNFYFLNSLINKLNLTNENIFSFYQESLALIINKNNEDHIYVYIFINFLKNINFKLNFKECSLCHQNNNIFMSFSLKNKGLICVDCITIKDTIFEPEELDLLSKIYLNDFYDDSLEEKYSHFQSLFLKTKKVYIEYIKLNKEFN